jgi:hypothetical protein
MMRWCLPYIRDRMIPVCVCVCVCVVCVEEREGTARVSVCGETERKQRVCVWGGSK